MGNLLNKLKDMISGGEFDDERAADDWYGKRYGQAEENEEASLYNDFDEPIYNAYEKPAESYKTYKTDILDQPEEEVSYSEPHVVEFSHMLSQHILIVHPESKDDSPAISREVRGGRTVILNFENMGDDEAQRVLDFLSGAAYALDGKVMTISKKIFMITPRHTEVNEGLSYQLEKENMEQILRSRAAAY